MSFIDVCSMIAAVGTIYVVAFDLVKWIIKQKQIIVKIKYLGYFTNPNYRNYHSFSIVLANNGSSPIMAKCIYTNIDRQKYSVDSNSNLTASSIMPGETLKGNFNIEANSPLPEKMTIVVSTYCKKITKHISTKLELPPQ